MKAGAKMPQKHSPWKANEWGICDSTIGTEGSDSITVNLALKDYEKVAVGVRVHVPYYISSDSLGQTPVATAMTGAVAVGTSGGLQEFVTGKSGFGITTTAGLLDVKITDSGAKTVYLNICSPDGTITTIGPITFA